MDLGAAAREGVEVTDDANEYWFRLEDQRYAASLDEFDEPIGRGRLVVHVRKFKVVRHTPKGVWLIGGSYGGDPRFVLRGARRRFACQTLDEAKESFEARKSKQARIYRARADTSDEAVQLVRQGFIEEGFDW
jgi:hypothetical protein